MYCFQNCSGVPTKFLVFWNWTVSETWTFFQNSNLPSEKNAYTIWKYFDWSHMFFWVKKYAHAGRINRLSTSVSCSQLSNQKWFHGEKLEAPVIEAPRAEIAYSLNCVCGGEKVPALRWKFRVHNNTTGCIVSMCQPSGGSTYRKAAAWMRSVTSVAS